MQEVLFKTAIGGAYREQPVLHPTDQDANLCVQCMAYNPWTYSKSDSNVQLTQPFKDRMVYIERNQTLGYYKLLI